MKSKTSNDSQERIKKATEILQKVWWFSWFLIIAPFIVATICFFIISLFLAEFYTQLSFSVISFMFALLFFYKAFDKYRNNPLFLNKKNNLIARIHILFLISILPFIVSSIFIFVLPPGLSFVLPLISYAILYNIVYYYYYFQPIDFFDLAEDEFKHAKNLKLIVKQPHNFLIFINYIIHIIFLAFTATTNFSWIYALITNLVFYFITLTSSKNLINRIKDSMTEKKAFLKELTLFKQRFVVALVSLFFIILIQMPFVIIITLSFLGVPVSPLEILNNSFLTVIFILFYLKSRSYISVHYTTRLSLYEDSEKFKKLKEKAHLSTTKYQKYNSYLSGILILLITLFSFLIKIPVLILIILPFLYILFHYEQKTELCPKKYNRFVILFNSIAILISISFGVIPSLFGTVLFNFLVFCLSFYFILQLFGKFKYFIKENILIYQNLLAVASFSFFIYIFFPVIVFEYTIFTSDPFIIFISNFLINLILFLVILLVSFYVLYARVFHAKRTKLFRISVIINIFLIEIVLFILINLRMFFLVDTFTFFQVLVLTTILFPTIFIIFIGINYFLGILPTRDFLITTYYSIWILIATIFVSIFLSSFNNYPIIVLDLLLLSIFLHFNLKFGLKLDKLTTSAFEKFVKINSYILTFELFFLFFTIFFRVFQFLLIIDNIIYSTYLSLAIVCILINLLSKKEIFSESFYIKINVFILVYSSIIAFYYFLLLTLTTFYVFIIPLLVSSLIIYLPILYLRKKKLYPKLIAKSLIINSVLLSATVSLIPTIIGLDLFYLGAYFDLIFLIITVINFTLYIVFAIFTIFYYISKRVKSSEKRLKLFLRLQVFTAFCISATTIFYYPFYLLIDFLFYSIILPSIFTSFFLYIPFYYSYKKAIFNINHIKIVIMLNTMVLTGLVTLLPTLIGLNLIYLGFLFDFSLFVLSLINFSLYIFYTFLLILNYLSKKFELKKKFNLILKQLQIIFLLSISFTTVFCYPVLLLLGTFYSIIIPLIALLCSWFFLFYYSYKREYFNLERIKKLTIYNFIVLSFLIISLPPIIGSELIRIGFVQLDWTTIILIITTTILFLFSFLKISELISERIKLKESYIKRFKLSGIISWFLFTVFLSYYIASIFIERLTLNSFTLLIISCSLFIFFVLSMYTLKLSSDYSPELSIFNYLPDIIVYGIILSISFIFTFLILSTNLFAFIFFDLVLNILMLIGFFFTVFLLFLIIFDNLIKLKLTQVKIILELTAWLVIKIIICTLTLFLIELYLYQFFIANKIFLFSLSFTFLTPLSLYILKNLKYISSENQFLMKKITLTVFIISILSVYLEILYNLIDIIPFFNQNLLLQITVIIANLVLFLYYTFLSFNKTIEDRSVFTLYLFYILSLILFVSLLYFNSILTIFLLLISYIIILSQRSIIPIFRFLSYFLLSYVTFIEILAILNFYGVIVGFDIVLTTIFIIIYLLSMSGVLSFSILLNLKKNNNLEKFALYSLISLLSFVSLMRFIWVLYNITISILILLLFIGIFFYRQHDERYKWFIKPCVLLFIFDLISFMSYSWFFNNQIFGLYNPILTFTLTMSITGFGFVLLYNDAPARFRKKSFYIVLISIVLSFPIFLYFLIIASLSMPLVSVVPLIVAINFGVFLYYLSIGIYQWRVSWAIWKSGWYAWNVLPFVNFYIIYQSFTGIDVLTNSLQFGAFSVDGSLIISIIICSLFFLPVVYSKIKKYFSLIVFIIWGESLFLLYWISQNLFVADILLRNLSFGLFSITLLMPLLAAFKYWKIISIFWLFPLTFINAWFLPFYLMLIGISLEIAISIDILVIGLFLIVYSFFPNIRSIGIILISAYFITLSGIFLTIYFILYSIILNPIFSVNISFIVVGFALFSSKYTQIPKRFIDLCLSWILIFNLSWLTFNTFSLFPGLLPLAFSLALTVGGCSFFIFNRYKMKFRINKIIPYLIVAVGASLSVTSLISIIFKASLGILISTFTSVFILFLYFIFTEYRYMLWFAIPIPIATPILELLLIFEFIQPFWLLTWSMLYLISFQILINIFKNLVKVETPEIKNSILKLFQDRNQVKRLNLTCFLLNSICISLFIAIILPNLLKHLLFPQILVVYQICDFLIIWPFLFLFCLKYIEKSKLDIKIKNPLLYFNKISFILYLLIPIALAINIFLYMMFINIDMVISIYSFLLIASGVTFFESYFIDRSYFYLLFDSTRKSFILWSWFAFSNTLSLFLYLFHLNIFLLVLTISLLNLISLYFLSYLDISKRKISIARLILIYNSFIWSSFYIASLISDGLILLFEELRGFPYYSLLFQNSTILLYALSFFFVKIEKYLKNRIEFILFILFQGLLVINLFYILAILDYLNFFLINLVILIEICLSFNSIRYINIIIDKQKYPNFLPKMHSFMVLILYFELSIMMYGLLSEFLGIIESIMVSVSILFVLTLLDIYSIKKVKRSYASLVHTISFFTISLMLLLILNNLISQYPFLLSLEIFIFLIMQFYTNYSLFASLKDFYPNNKDTLNKIQIYIQHTLGTGFYITLSISILQGLILQRFEIQLILLILNLVIHVLMIIDTYLLKFLGVASRYVKVISWIFIMIFTSTYLMWLYSIYFVTILLTVIPIIIFILILEFAYLFKLLVFWQLIVSNKEKIRFYLIGLSYLNFISWPLYFASLNPFLVHNLVLASLFIMFFLTYIDNFIGILEEKLRKSLRSYTFLIMGGLFSIDLFLLMNLIPDFNIFLNLSISSLVFILFLGIKVKPFKEHSIIALTFWVIIFILLSLIVYFISLSWIAGLAIFILTIMVYPFIFLLEELKELLNKLIDYFTKFFRNLKILIRNIFIKIISFVKTHFRSIWILFSIFISIFFGILLSPVILNLLHWIHSTLLIFPAFGLLYSIMPSTTSEDADVMFRRRMFRLIISWGSIIAVLFVFITVDWYIFTVWISIWIVGAILLPYISFKEKREKISIKWRFWTLVILIILLVLFGILLGLQIYVNFF